MLSINSIFQERVLAERESRQQSISIPADPSHNTSSDDVTFLRRQLNKVLYWS